MGSARLAMTRRFAIALVVLLAAMVAWTLPSAASGTIVVNTNLDAAASGGLCSLREAITAAETDTATGGCSAGSGADQVVLPAGHFTLIDGASGDDANAGGDLDVVAGQLTISGAGAGATIIDANHIDRVLDIVTGATVTVSGVEITGGRSPQGADGGDATGSGGPGGQSADGGGIRNAGSLTLLDSTVTGNQTGAGGVGGSGTGGFGGAGGAGGSGFGGAGGASGSGGGIFSSGALTVSHTTFTANTTGTGGAGGVGNGGNGGDGDSTSVNGGAGGGGHGGAGAASGSGGAIFVFSSGSLSLSDSTLAGNATGAGGAGGVGSGGTGGAAGTGGSGGPGGSGFGGDGASSGDGGAMVGGDNLIKNSLSGDHTGAGGAGGAGSGGTGTDGAAAGGGTGGDGAHAGRGGAISTTAGQTLNASLVAGNSAGAGGAGGDGSGATATGGSGGDGGKGGGIAGSVGARNYTNVTFNGNSAGAGGAAGAGSGGVAGPGGAGGALLNGAGNLTVVHATIDGNSAASGGAVSTGSGAVTTLRTTITTANGCAGPIASGGVHDPRDLRFVNTTCPGTTTGDPKLGPLQLNGGPTMTQRLGSGSAAIDQVPTSPGCPPHDQRGADRPSGRACDIGAVEDAPPTAATGAARNVGISKASLDGTVDPRGLATSYRLEIGTTRAYGRSTSPQGSASTVGFGVSQTLRDLRPFTTYHYRWVALNVDGASFGADRTFRTARPLIEGASLSPSSFAVAKAATPLKASASRRVRRGSKVRYRLAEGANVTFTVQQATKGVKLKGKGKGKGRCVRASSANIRALRRQLRKRLGNAATPKRLATALRKARCTLYVRKGRLHRHGAAGSNTVRFSGRIGGRALRLGRYRLELVAEEGGVHSATKRLRFRIVSGKPKPKR